MDFHKNGIRTTEVVPSRISPLPLLFFLNEVNEKNSLCEKIRDGADALLCVHMVPLNAWPTHDKDVWRTLIKVLSYATYK
jgi:hypothetical protein